MTTPEPDLKLLASRHRFMREAGFGLLLASCVLGVFLLLPSRAPAQPAAVAVAAASTTPDAFANVPVGANAAVVYDLTTGKELFAKNADAQLPLASLTKLLTMYAAFSELSAETPITVDATDTQVDAPHAFQAGDTLPLADIARVTLTGSLNDGAAAIARTTAAREGLSIHDMLANVASSLGLAETYAVNGNGLDVSTALSGGYGSAHDIAILAGALAAKAPEVAIATTGATATATTEAGRSITAKNTDPFVGTIPGLLLSKTGYTDLAGGNLALVFDVGLGHPVAVVVLGSTEEARFTDAEALVAATFAHFAGVAHL